AISVIAALPVLIAMARKHPHTGLVALLSIAVGWTGFAWFAALILALSPFKRPEPTIELLITLTDKPEDSKTCPRCAESVKAAAQICRFCGHAFPPDLELAPVARNSSSAA
ncbi:MAG: superinfection immunity protein, partial [Rhodospirillales bacterium]|nr:superinfection immunity protein [Rhodospirillales bacterium]